MAELKYALIMNYIKNEIVNGNLKKGDKIYSESKLMEKFCVSRQTVRQAMGRLLEEGYIITLHGKGSFVQWEEEDTSSQPPTDHNIMVMVSYLNNHILPSIIQKIENRCSDRGFDMVLRCTHNRVMQERECLRKVLNEGFCGLIAEPAKSALPSPNADLYEAIRQKGIPIIFMHGFFDEKHDDYVVVDDARAGYEACEQLIAAGHTRIGGVFKSDDIQGLRRYQGMMQALCDHHLKVDERCILWLSTEDQLAIFKDEHLQDGYFKRLQQVTATVCYNDDMAIAVADSLFRSGISIPDHHSIVSFDNTQYGSAYRVPISSMGHPCGEIGNLAFDGLEAKWKDPSCVYQTVLDVEYHEKQSVKPPPVV